MKKPDLRGDVPESWACIDCGINTAPGCLNRAQMERAVGLDWSGQGITQFIDDRAEVYDVRPSLWNKAGMSETGGCLCIGCLEKRLGRMLTPKDFTRNHPLNRIPGTERLMARRGQK
jgi:hypothetical protein